MATKKNIESANTVNNNVNVGSLTPTFAQFSDEKMIKLVANAIMQEARRAAEERLAQLGISSAPQAAVTVELAPAAKTEPAPAKSKAKTKPTKETAPKTKARKASEKTDKAKKDDEAEVLISITDKKAVKKLGLSFIPYKDKCQLILGDTKPLRKELGKLAEYGVFPGRHLAPTGKFEGGFAWLVNNKHAAEVGKMLGIKYRAAK